MSYRQESSADDMMKFLPHVHVERDARSKPSNTMSAHQREEFCESIKASARPVLLLTLQHRPRTPGPEKNLTEGYKNMWFVKVNKIDCNIIAIQESSALKCIAWAMHPIGRRDIPHYHFILDLVYKDSETVNKKVRALLLNPLTTSLKSTLLLKIDHSSAHPLQPTIEYMKRFMPCKDVWQTVEYWVDTLKVPDYPAGFLCREEKEKYNAAKLLLSQNNSPQTTTLLPQIITVKPPKKPTQRDIIGSLWEEIQSNIDSGYLDQDDRNMMCKFIFRRFVLKCRQEKLKFDRYQIIQYMNPLMCEFTKGYEDDLQDQVLAHFCNVR